MRAWEVVRSRCVGMWAKGFFLEGSENDAIHNALMLSLFKSKWGTCMLQIWVLWLNPNNLPFPTWVSFRNLSFEHRDQAYAIIETLEEVIGIDNSQVIMEGPWICINVNVTKGWVTSLALNFIEEFPQLKMCLSTTMTYLSFVGHATFECIKLGTAWKHKDTQLKTLGEHDDHNIQCIKKKGNKKPLQHTQMASKQCMAEKLFGEIVDDKLRTLARE